MASTHAVQRRSFVDTPNRELNNVHGRWLSPDPAGAGWNQYAYPTNPNSFVDPSGLCPDCDSNLSRLDALGSRDEPCFTNPSCYMYPPGLFATPNEMQAGLSTYLSSIPGYIIQDGHQYWHAGFFTPNPKYDPNTPGSVVGVSTSALFDLGSVSDAANNEDPYAKSPLSQFLKKLIFRPYSFGVLLPVIIPAGPAGTLSFDLDKGFVCLGVGGGVGARGVNGGPLWGDTQNSGAVLSGASASVNVAGPVGAQVIQNPSGKLYGPTVGAPGASLTITYSWCSGK